MISKKVLYCAFVVFLFAVMLAGVGSAEEPRNVENGSLVFVHEYISISDTTGATTLTHYSEGGQAGNTISAGNGVFTLYESSVNGQYGRYYYSGNPSSGDGKYLEIYYPEISLQAELTQPSGGVAGDSIDGKIINKKTNITFLINAPKVGQAEVGATAEIVFATPAGGKTTYFGSENFANIELSAAQTVANGRGVEAGESATAGVWTAQAEFISPSAFTNAKKSNTISFTLQSITLTIWASKDSVVRSNPFTVTISGSATSPYAVYLESSSVNPEEVNPVLQKGQIGFKGNFSTLVASGGSTSVDEGSSGVFQTDASGKRTIQYNTYANTEDKTYTVKVNPVIGYTDGEKTVTIDTSDYDSVKVKVEKGAVTISAAGDGSYFIGEEIKLTGTNTDSDLIFLFISGKNLPENGSLVNALPDKVTAKDNTQPVSVKTDNTWEYKWDTTNCGLDTGVYTIYATSRLTNGQSSEAELIVNQDAGQYGTIMDGKSYAVKLSDSEYATISINLKGLLLSATPSETIVAKGGAIYIRGTARGDPNSLRLYLFGPNFFEPFTITVDDDGTYEKRLDIGPDWASNQYFVVVQHPAYNNKFDVYLEDMDGGTEPFDRESTHNWTFKTSTTTTGGDALPFIVWGQNKLQGSAAANALGKMIEQPHIDDIYVTINFLVTKNDPTPEPDIPPSNGDTVTITASTTTIILGENVTFRGLSTEGKDVYLFMTGPNLLTNGVVLKDLPTRTDAGKATDPIPVNTDTTWEYQWDTSNGALDTGTYIVYATDRLTNGKGTTPYGDAVSILTSNYASATIVLKQPYLTMAPSNYHVQKGESLRITGTATGNPEKLTYYLFGPDRYLHGTTAVGNDNSYEIVIPTTAEWEESSYFLIVEHPMYNDTFDITETKTDTTTTLSVTPPPYSGGQTIAKPVIVEGAGSLRGSNAADALARLIDSANIDDIYRKYSFVVYDGTFPTTPSINVGETTEHLTREILSETFIPSGNLKPGEKVTGIVKINILKSTGSALMQFDSDLSTPQWSAVITDRQDEIPYLTLPKDMPDYIDGWLLSNSPKDTLLTLTITGTVPNTIGREISQLIINESNTAGNTLFRYTSPKQLIISEGLDVSATLPLSINWNFISIPKTLSSGEDTAEKLFAHVNTDNHQILGYNTRTSSWEAVNATDIIKPLNGYWIYAKEPTSLMLSFTKEPAAPAVKTVYAGWNAVGLSANEPADARNAFAGTNWRTAIPWNLNSGGYGTAVINGGTGNSDPAVNSLQPGWGYWLYVENPGTLTGLTV
ncbi:MAG: MEMAR_RS02690 family S-layer glycoprotein [Methanocorpusculum sp.]|nr:MEMAR_RS02690 family S-layer glycoprotein [Methanocorpusculum sp.]